MSIVVIGSRSFLRAGLVSLLGTVGFESVQEADDFKHLRGRSRAKPCADILIVCLVLAFENVTARVGEIRAWEPTARIVFVVPKLDLAIMTVCFAEGVRGYLLETISRDGLLQSLKLITAGEKVFPSELAAQFPMLIAKICTPEPGNLAPPESDLSPRENDVLRCLSDGQSNKVIARNLDIAEATVKVHVKRILRKTRVKNRTQAALWGIANGVGSASTKF